MGGTTPIYSIPYPTGTDLIGDGDNAIQALANRMEVLLTAVAAETADSGWIGPTLQNGWTRYDANWAPPGYRKIGKMVFMRGLLRPGTSVGGTVITTLPVGYRIAENTHSPIAAGGFGAVNIMNNGDVKTNTPSAGGVPWISFDGISFLIG